MANYDGDIQLKVDLTPGDITSTTDEMRKTIESIFKTTKGDKMTAPFKSLLATMDKAYNKSGKLLDRLKELEGRVVLNKEYAELEQKLEAASERAKTLKEQLANTSRFSNERLAITEELKKANAEMHTLLSQMQDMRDNGKAYMNYTDTAEGAAEREKVLSELKAVNDQMTISTQRANEMQGGNLAWREFIQDLMITHPLLAIVANRLSNVAEKAGQAVGKLLNFAKTHFGIKALAKHAADAAKNLAKMVGRGIISGFKRLTSAITKTNKASSNANGTFKKGFLFLLRYALGIRSIYFLFRRLRKALGEGIGNLAQYSSPFNQVISNFISALTRLKNTFATAFAPIINVVLPIITTFINAISAAVTKVGMLIAALTGKKTFIAAKAVQEDFAGSMDGAADAANGANEAAKEYQKTISGFDDVEILKNPDNNGSPGGGGNGGGGGGGGIDPADMFETVELPAGYYDLAQMIKDSWENANFTKLGELLGQKIAEALYNIPWDTIQQFAGNFGKSFATFINGLISVPELATAIGYTIGQALNTLFVLANAFVTNLNWEQIGKFFADVMNEGIKTIKWDLIVDTLATAANGIFNALNTWATTFDFGALATAISNTVRDTLNGLNWENIKAAVSNLGAGLAEFVNNLIKPSTFSSIGTTIAEAINTAIAGIKSFAIEFDGKNLGKSIASAVNTFFSTFNFKQAGITFGTVTDKVFDAIATAIQEIRWKDVGKDLQDFVLSIPWGTLIGDVATIAGSAAGALASLVAGLFSGLPTAISNYFAEKTNQQGGNIVAGIFMGIADFFISIGTWIKENIFDPFVNGFKTTFGISSPASTMLEYGGYIIEGVFQGILDWITNNPLSKWIKDHIFEPFKNGWDAVFGDDGWIDKGEDWISNLFGGNSNQDKEINVKVGLEKASSWVEEAWTAISSDKKTLGTTVATKLAQASDWASNAWTAISSNAKTLSTTVSTGLQQAGDWTSGTAGNVWTAIKSNGQTLTNTVSTGLAKFGNWASDTAKNVWTALSTTKKDNTVETALTRGTWDTVAEYALNAPKKHDSVLTQGIKKMKGTWDKAALAVTKIKKTTGDGVKRLLTQSVKQGSWNDYAYAATKIKSNTGLNRKVTQSVVRASGSGWDNYALSVAQMPSATGNKAIQRQIKVLATKYGSWADSVINALKVGASSGSITKTINLTISWIGQQLQAAWKVLTGATGGIFRNGMKTPIAQYATGGVPSHGTMFVAGEAGAEAVGHIHGRTEVLNQSQMAAVMYSSVIAAVAPVINYMKECTNAIIANIGSELNYLKFMSGQLYTINTLGNSLSTNVGNIVTGKVVPNNFNSNDLNNLNQTLDKLSSMLYDTRSNAVTRDELTSILTTMFTRYMNFSCYIGDEDIARHANNGNARLEMRFSPVAR